MPRGIASRILARFRAPRHRNSGGSKTPRIEFTSSDRYWEQRYDSGGNSGAGSYNRLARFKADFLNNFVKLHEVRSVLEFGSGDGAQVALAEYPAYVGVDVSHVAVNICRRKFSNRPDLRFMHIDEVPDDLTADLVLSLDVVYHLVEDEVFEAYMHRLFDASTRSVIIYSSNVEEPSRVPHVRHRNFTAWVEEKRPEFKVVQHVKNRHPFDPADPVNTSFADFYVFERQAA
ncbi:bifunctional 2-polyprenyl-6-hydroxyphenol methylase/3-demethylubiquinol 3-O-methyltransferase UbiG [Sphingosinicella sp. CPCC 101087]|uniref:class I SAM-dependent methyltransferase n=1 Tax=Sphingosinicella sp. CPCC 101087 TaxID=2497754 RepID=UPI0013ECF290|nr:class I SAM-dependent methyltransferase [Sphingosinicella sp. CPCC 101087]